MLACLAALQWGREGEVQLQFRGKKYKNHYESHDNDCEIAHYSVV